MQHPALPSGQFGGRVPAVKYFMNNFPLILECRFQQVPEAIFPARRRGQVFSKFDIDVQKVNLWQVPEGEFPASATSSATQELLYEILCGTSSFSDTYPLRGLGFSPESLLLEHVSQSWAQCLLLISAILSIVRVLLTPHQLSYYDPLLQLVIIYNKLSLFKSLSGFSLLIGYRLMHPL